MIHVKCFICQHPVTPDINCGYNCRNCGFNEGWDAPQKSQLDLFKKPIAIKEKKELDYEEL